MKEWPASVKIWQIQTVDKSKPPKNDKSGRELAADWDPPLSIIPLSCFDATNNDWGPAHNDITGCGMLVIDLLSDG